MKADLAEKELLESKQSTFEEESRERGKVISDQAAVTSYLACSERETIIFNWEKLHCVTLLINTDPCAVVQENTFK